MDIPKPRRFRKPRNLSKPFGCCAEEDVQAACVAVNNGMSQSEASRRFMVPRSTIKDRLKGVRPFSKVNTCGVIK